MKSAFTLDFVDPLSRLLDVRAPRLVSLAIDPRRTSPKTDDDLIKEVAGVDAIIEPRCPIVPDRETITAIFRPALSDRRAVQISPCWTLWLKAEPGAAPAIAASPSSGAPPVRTENR